MKKNLFYIITIIIIVMFSCKKENKKLSWDINYLGPVAYSTMTISDIIADSNMVVNQDNMVSFIYKDSFYGIGSDSIFAIPDTNIKFTASLNNLSINNIEESDKVSLGDIAQKDYEENGVNGSLYTAIMNGQNTGLPVNIDPIPTQSYSDINIDASEYFETMTLEYAVVEIDIDNQLPIALTNVFFELKNSTGGEIILSENYANIAAGEFVHTEQILTNFTIEGQMLGNISIESPGGNNVLIDTSKAVTATFKVHDIKIISALAHFPNQDIINLDDKLILDINQMQLNKVNAKSGNINFVVNNTLSEEIHFNFLMPEVKKNSVPLSFSGTVPASNNGVSGEYSQFIDLSGYKINMQGSNYDTVNVIQYILNASIDSTENAIPLSLNDSISLVCEFNNLKPEYAEGWFGKDTIWISDQTELNILPELQNANIDFNQVKLGISIENGIGVNAGLQINNLKAINSQTSNTATLQMPSEYNPFVIDKAQNTGTGSIPAYNEMKLNAQNSNTNELINIIPDKLQYDIGLLINHNQAPPLIGNGTDFIYSNSNVKANIEVEIPLSLIASNIILNDTVDLNIKDLSEINSGEFYLFAYNMFPLSAKVQIYMLDESLKTTDSLFVENTYILAGSVNNQTLKVKEATKSKLAIPLSKDKFDKLIHTKKLKITAEFETVSQAEYVKIYSDYTLKLKLTGDFEYNIK